MRRASRPHKSAPSKPAPLHAAQAAAPQRVPSLLESRLAFTLYAIGVIGCLGTITTLIERAAP